MPVQARPVVSSVKLGDEQKKGVEKQWRTEYIASYNEENLRNPPAECTKGKGPSVEQILDQKIFQFKHGGTHIRKLLQEVDIGNKGTITADAFDALLNKFNIFLDPRDLQALVEKYDKGRGWVDYREFLYNVNPDEFPKVTVPYETISKQEWRQWSGTRTNPAEQLYL